MGDNTGISWTDASWNPVVGCSIVSPGCTNCYAMSMAARIVAMQPASHYAGTIRTVNGNTVWTGKVALAPDHILAAPLKWKKPRRIFVNSMGDLFHEDVPDAWIDRVFAIMALAPQHIYQILTKRSRRMREYYSAPDRLDRIVAAAESYRSLTGETVHSFDLPAHNIWLGVSAEDQTRANERIPDLLNTPAGLRFVSAEPLLGPTDFTDIDVTSGNTRSLNALAGEMFEPGNCGQSSQSFSTAKLDWVICGGESGPGYRPMQIEWAEAIRDQCKAAGAAFFFKQDSAPHSGMRGRASDALWATKEFPA